MKKIICLVRILKEYNKIAKNKIDLYGARILQEEAKKLAMETGNDAHIEVRAFESKDGATHIIR